jgi:hypothetical protein
MNLLLKNIFICLLLFSYPCNYSVETKERIKNYDSERLKKIGDVQRDLIVKGQIVSNQVVMYKDGQIIYNSIVNSNLNGDENITDKTIFPLFIK